MGERVPEVLHEHRQYSMQILQALRKIIHAMDVYSRRLSGEYNITGPQLLCLYYVVNFGPMIQSELSRHLSMSVSTVNGVLDRLAIKGYVVRERAVTDRRRVNLTATESGRQLILNTPPPFHNILLNNIERLSEVERVSLGSSLQRIAELMETCVSFAESN